MRGRAAPRGAAAHGCSVVLREHIAAPGAVARSRQHMGPKPSSQHRGNRVGQVPMPGLPGAIQQGRDWLSSHGACSPLPAALMAEPPGQTMLNHASTQLHLHFSPPSAQASRRGREEEGQLEVAGWHGCLHLTSLVTAPATPMPPAWLLPSCRSTFVSPLPASCSLAAAISTSRPARAAEPASLAGG